MKSNLIRFALIMLSAINVSAGTSSAGGGQEEVSVKKIAECLFDNNQGESANILVEYGKADETVIVTVHQSDLTGDYALIFLTGFKLVKTSESLELKPDSSLQDGFLIIDVKSGFISEPPMYVGRFQNSQVLEGQLLALQCSYLDIH